MSACMGTTTDVTVSTSWAQWSAKLTILPEVELYTQTYHPMLKVKRIMKNVSCLNKWIEGQYDLGLETMEFLY